MYETELIAIVRFSHKGSFRGVWNITVDRAFKNPRKGSVVRNVGEAKTIFRRNQFHGTMTEARDVADDAVRRMKHGGEGVTRITYTFQGYGRADKQTIGTGGNWT